MYLAIKYRLALTAAFVCFWLGLALLDSGHYFGLIGYFFGL